MAIVVTATRNEPSAEPLSTGEPLEEQMEAMPNTGIRLMNIPAIPGLTPRAPVVEAERHSDRAGVDAAGWLLTAVAVLAALLMATTVRSYLRVPAAVPVASPFPPEQFLSADDQVWPGHWVTLPVAWETRPGVILNADKTLAVVRAAIADLPSPRPVGIGRSGRDETLLGTGVARGEMFPLGEA